MAGAAEKRKKKKVEKGKKKATGKGGRRNKRKEEVPPPYKSHTRQKRSLAKEAQTLKRLIDPRTVSFKKSAHLAAPL